MWLLESSYFVRGIASLLVRVQGRLIAVEIRITMWHNLRGGLLHVCGVHCRDVHAIVHMLKKRKQIKVITIVSKKYINTNKKQKIACGNEFDFELKIKFTVKFGYRN